MIVPTSDLSANHGVIRDQGGRQTCLAFCLSDLNGVRHGLAAGLSAEFLFREAALKMTTWLPGDGLELGAALDAVAAPGQPQEAHCPYQATDPTLPLSSLGPFAPMYRGQYTRFVALSAALDVALTQGSSVGLVLRLTAEFFHPDKFTGIVRYSPNYLPGNSHAVLAVGLGQDASSQAPHYLIRNSWGDDWGLGGHAWLPWQYISMHALCAFGE